MLSDLFSCQRRLKIVCYVVLLGIISVRAFFNEVAEPRVVLEHVRGVNDESHHHIAAILEPPFIISGGENSIMHGKVLLPILRQAYAEIGIDIVYKPLPAARSLRLANTLYSGEVARYTEAMADYPNLMKVPVLFMHVRASAHSLDPTIQIKNWEDLEPYRVAVRRGVALFQKKTLHMKDRVVTTSLQQSIAMLLSDRVDVLLAVDMDFDYVLNEMKKNREVVRDPVIYQQLLVKIPVYHFIHKKHANIMPDITRELKKLVESGAVDRAHAEVLQR